MEQKASPLTYLKLIGAMFLWGGAWIAGRIIAQELSAPLMAGAMRFLLAALVLALFAFVSSGNIPRPTKGREWGAVTGLAFTGIFIYGLCFFYGLKHVSAGRGALVVALNPIVVALTAWFLGQERLTPLKLAGISIALVGCLIVIGDGNPLALFHGSLGVGEWLLMGCVLSWTAYTFIGRRATHSLSPLAATLYASLIGAFLLGITALLQGGVDIDAWSWRVWTSVIFLAIGSTALAFTWFTDGVKHLGASKAIVFVNLVPVFAVLQAILLLGERFNLAVFGGGLLVMAGVWLTTYFSEKTL